MSTTKKYFSLELFFWITALIYLASINPSTPRFSFCLFKYLGINFCPGCGIGQSISYLLHGDIIKSFDIHKLGTFALLVIVYRIMHLCIKYFKSLKNKNYGQSISST